MEASAVKSITSTVVKNFIETKILHRYGVPETIVTDRGPSFISKEVEEFASKYKIKMIQSSPYYPQSNGQAEASNKILVNIIKRMVIDSPEKWHEMLGNTLWAYRTSKRAGTGTTPYALTFGQDAVLPMEINVSSVRIQNQFGLHSAEYIEAMCQGIEDLDVARIEALNQIQEGKIAVARAYNKKVKVKSFKEGDLVWKTVLPLGAQLRGFGKWSPTWEAGFPTSSWMEPNRVIGLCGQHGPGRGSSDGAVTICDGEAQLITATCGKASHQEEAA
ncbi:hypothetical protein ACFX2F_043601 [Malus domestica]